MAPRFPVHIYEVRPRKDHRGFDLISDPLPFGRVWYEQATGNRLRQRVRSLHIADFTTAFHELLLVQPCRRANHETSRDEAGHSLSIL